MMANSGCGCCSRRLFVYLSVHCSFFSLHFDFKIHWFRLPLMVVMGLILITATGAINDGDFNNEQHPQHHRHIVNVNLNHNDNYDYGDYGDYGDGDASNDHYGFFDNGHNDSMCRSDTCITYAEKLNSAIDKDAKPCDNFYQFVCGKWILEHPIPKYRDSWSQFQLFSLMIRTNLKKHLESRTIPINGDHNLTIIYQKLDEFYHGCKNKTQRDMNGYRKLYQLIRLLGGWPMLDGWNEHDHNGTMFRWEEAYTVLAGLNIQYFIGIEQMIDFRNTTKIITKIGPPYKTSENIINLHHGRHGLLPAIKRTKVSGTGSQDDLEQYKRLFLNMLLELRQNEDHRPPNGTTDHLNQTQLLHDIDEMFALQERLVNLTGPIYSMAYYQKHYERHLMKLSNISGMVSFDIGYLLTGLFRRNFSDDELIFVPDIEYLRALGPLLDSIPKRTQANYMSANMVYQLAPYTTTKMIEMLSAKLDSPEVLPNLCYAETAANLPELIGRLYLDVGFNRTVPVNLGQMADLLWGSFREFLSEQSQWMDNSTTAEAIRKLDAMSVNVGYPPWLDNVTVLKSYGDLFAEVDSSDYIGSVMAVSRARKRIAHQLLEEDLVSIFKFNHPVMLSWPQNPIIDVNAFYYFTTNGVYIPAGILQDIIYSTDLPGAIVFGSIGMILGHEMTHAFDSSGRLYDEHGALRDWWTAQTKDLFVEKTRCFINQYSNYSIDNIMMDGIQTLEENIADNGGLRQAYRAFKQYQAQHPDEKWRLPGAMAKYTSEQLFFISFAHMWCANLDQQAVKEMVEFNEHSPPPVRVQGSLANFERFAEVFNCTAGTPMNPREKCTLW